MKSNCENETGLSFEDLMMSSIRKAFIVIGVDSVRRSTMTKVLGLVTHPVLRTVLLVGSWVVSWKATNVVVNSDKSPDLVDLLLVVAKNKPVRQKQLC